MWFFWTLQVLLQRSCSTWMGVCTHTDTEEKQSPEYFKIFEKTQYLMSTLYVHRIPVLETCHKYYLKSVLPWYYFRSFCRAKYKLQCKTWLICILLLRFNFKYKIRKSKASLIFFRRWKHCFINNNVSVYYIIRWCHHMLQYAFHLFYHSVKMIWITILMHLVASAPIGTWKCNFSPPPSHYMADWPTNGKLILSIHLQ